MDLCTVDLSTVANELYGLTPRGISSPRAISRASEARRSWRQRARVRDQAAAPAPTTGAAWLAEPARARAPRTRLTSELRRSRRRHAPGAERSRRQGPQAFVDIAQTARDSTPLQRHEQIAGAHGHEVQRAQSFTRSRRPSSRRTPTVRPVSPLLSGNSDHLLRYSASDQFDLTGVVGVAPPRHTTGHTTATHRSLPRARRQQKLRKTAKAPKTDQPAAHARQSRVNRRSTTQRR